MTISRFHIIALLMLLQIARVYGQDAKINIPGFNDKYTRYVRQLEDGKTDIDYTDFRNSFLESKQFYEKSSNYDSLEQRLYKEVKNKNYTEVIRITKGMLSIDYTSLTAHKFLQQTYKILGDSINKKKYHDIEFGLLYSITKSGDGKTCETGWHVTQIEEEYFIINYVLAADFLSQGITSSKNNSCDRMEVKMETGENETFYFEANKVFEMEMKLFGK